MNPFDFSHLSTADLLDQLRSLDEDELRVAIVLELVMRGNSRVIDDLVDLLDTQTEMLRLTAVWALGEFSDPRAIQPLISLLLYEYGDIVPAAMESLRKIGDPVIKPIIAALADASEDDCGVLGDALATIGTVASFAATLEAAHAQNPMARAAAAIALGSFRATKGIEPLVELTKDANTFVQSNAAFALQFAKGNAMAGDALLALVDATNADVLENVVVALGLIGEKRARNQLLSLLKHPDVVIVSAVLRALPELEDPSIVPAIVMCLEDNNDRIRSQALAAIARIGDKSAVPALTNHLSTEQNLDILQEVAQVLGRLGDEETLATLKTLNTSLPGIMIAQLQLGDDAALQHFLKMIRSHDIKNRLDAIWAFSGFHDTRAVPPLIGALVDGEWEVRSEAALALGQLKAQQASRALIELLGSDEMPAVRESAAYALGAIESQRGTKALIHALQYDDAEVVRSAAAASIGEIKDARGLKPLIVACLDVSDMVRSTAAYALGNMKDQAAIPSLKTLLNDEYIAPRVAAAEALHMLNTDN